MKSQIMLLMPKVAVVITAAMLVLIAYMSILLAGVSWNG